jgi:molybdopterin converting factor small subunit
MATVIFASGMRGLTNGDESVVIAAPRVAELIDALYARYPALAGRLDQASVAIDGTLYNDARYQRLRPDSEVHFLAPLAGG